MSNANQDGGTSLKTIASNGGGSNANKELVMVNLAERMNCLIEALFSVWSTKRSAIPADVFYQKMTTYSLVPDLKTIQEIMDIVHYNRPKKILTAMQREANSKSPSRRKKHSLERFDSNSHSSVSMLGYSRHESPGTRRSTFGGGGYSPRKSVWSTGRQNPDATLSSTVHSVTKVGRRLKEADEDTCQRVKIEMFKAIYGHGLNLKFVKLLFLFLKKHVTRFIKGKNKSIASQRPQQHTQADPTVERQQH